MNQLGTLDQRRAGAALEAVTDVERSNAAKEYATQAKGLPALLISSGLAPTLAFLAGKTDAHRRLAADVSRWVLERVLGRSGAEDPTRECLRRLSESDSATYRRAEGEALEIATWLKRFAQAYLEDRP